MWAYSFAWGRNDHVYRGFSNESVTVPLREFLMRAGRDGWELCTSLPEGDGQLLIFKRETHA